MYSIRFGVLSSLLSDALVSGFTTGAAIGVLTSQVKDLVGIKLTQVLGKFEIVLVCNRMKIFIALMHLKSLRKNSITPRLNTI